jgi:hypothetical protein
METKNVGTTWLQVCLDGCSQPNELAVRGSKRMKQYKVQSTAWVSEDGSFSYNNQLITFDPDLLTEKQWETLDELADSERIEYALAVIEGDDLSEWEG